MSQKEPVGLLIFTDGRRWQQPLQKWPPPEFLEKMKHQPTATEFTPSRSTQPVQVATHRFRVLVDCQVKGYDAIYFEEAGRAASQPSPHQHGDLLERLSGRITALLKEGNDHIASWREGSDGSDHSADPDPECLACDDIFGQAALLDECREALQGAAASQPSPALPPQDADTPKRSCQCEVYEVCHECDPETHARLSAAIGTTGQGELSK